MNRTTLDLAVSLEPALGGSFSCARNSALLGSAEI